MAPQIARWLFMTFMQDKELVRMGDERVPVLSVAISPDKSQIGFGNAKGMVKIIDMASMSLLRDFKAANGTAAVIITDASGR